MVNVTREIKNSASGSMNIVGMLPYPLEKSFCKSFRDCAMSSSKTVCNWNPLYYPGKDSIRI